MISKILIAIASASVIATTFAGFNIINSQYVTTIGWYTHGTVVPIEEDKEVLRYNNHSITQTYSKYLVKMNYKFKFNYGDYMGTGNLGKWNSKHEADEQIRQSIGKHVTIYYDPTNISNNSPVLQNLNSTFYVVLFTAIITLLISIIFKSILVDHTETSFPR